MARSGEFVELEFGIPSCSRRTCSRGKVMFHLPAMIGVGLDFAQVIRGVELEQVVDV